MPRQNTIGVCGLGTHKRLTGLPSLQYSSSSPPLAEDYRVAIVFYVSMLTATPLQTPGQYYDVSVPSTSKFFIFDSITAVPIQLGIPPGTQGDNPLEKKTTPTLLVAV